MLAITTLADLSDYRPWAGSWEKALRHCFPDEWRALASRAGSGLRELMQRNVDLEEAHHTCVNGLLASQPPTIAALTAAGERLLGDALEALEARATA